MKTIFVHIVLFILIIIIFLPLVSISQWEMATGFNTAKTYYMVSVDSVLIAISDERGIYSKSVFRKLVVLR